MIVKRRAIPGLVVLALLTPLLMGSSDLREDQFECEQAVSHLIDCCPASFDPTQVDCEYDPGCGTPSYPSLPVDRSKCIEQLTCGQIQAAGLCDLEQDGGTAFDNGACE